jgi:hypothetical protein
VHFNFVEPFDTLRYSVNYFPLLCIFISSISYKIFFDKLKRPKRIIYFGFSTLAVIAIVLSVNLRLNLSKDEYYTRIEPVLETLKITQKQDIIITDIPLVFYCYAGVDQWIVDYYRLTPQKLEELLANNENKTVYFLSNNQPDIARYKVNMNISNFKHKTWETSLENYKLIQFEN